MKDEDLVKLINKVGYVEGLPVVVDPGVINPKDFIDTVTKVRLPNPFMPDAPQRGTLVGRFCFFFPGTQFKNHHADPAF